MPSHRTGVVALRIEIIGHLDGHITIDQETTALISDFQIFQSSKELDVPRSGGIDFQCRELLCDIIILFRICLDDFKTRGLNGLINHKYVSNANVTMMIAFLDHVKPAYQAASQIETRAKGDNHVPRQA
jgi:hypothetical protein